MIKTTLLCVPVLLVLALTAPTVTAGHCNGPYLTVEAGPETMYLEERPDGSEYRLVVYLESNEIPGL